MLAELRLGRLTDQARARLLDSMSYFVFDDRESILEAIADGDLPPLDEACITLLLEHDEPPIPVPSALEPLLLDALRFDLRRARNGYLQEELSRLGIPCTVTGELPPSGQCPCCGFLSIDAGNDGAWDICLVCFWENGGAGPNRMSLAQARRNFARLGARHERHLQNVEPDGPRKYAKGPPLEP